MYSFFCYGRLKRTARPQNRILKIFVCLKCYAVFERTLIKTNSRGRPAGLNTALWARVDKNYPYLVNNEDPYLKRTEVFVAAPTFKFTKKSDGADKDTLAAAFGGTKTTLSGYDFIEDASLFNVTATAGDEAVYAAGNKVLYVLSDETVVGTAATSIYAVETLASTTVGGSTKLRTGLRNLNTTNMVVSTGFDSDEMDKIDTVTLFASYYGAIIHTGMTGVTEPTLPIGLDPFSLYTADDMKYIDELHTIFGDSGTAGTTYTMKNDIDMGATAINRLTNNETFNAGTGGRIVLDGNGKTLKVKVGAAEDGATGLFGEVQGKFTIQKLNVNVVEWRIRSNADVSAHGILIGRTSGTTTNVVIDQVHINMNKQPGTEANGWWGLAGGMIGYAVQGNLSITKSSVFDIDWNMTSDKNHSLGGLVGYSNVVLSISESYATGKIKGSNLSANAGVGGFVGRANSQSTTITNSYSLVDMSNRAGDTTVRADTGGIGIFIGGTGATVTTSITNSYGASHANDTRFVNGGNAGTQTNTHSNIARGSAAVYDGLSATAGTAGLPAGLANTIWARVEANWPYLVNNEDVFLKRTKVYIPAPTAFKYAKKADGAGADTMALALGIGAKAGLSGYDIIEDASLFNITSGVSEYDAGKKVTFVITDTAAAQPVLYTTETIATTTVGSSEQRAGLSNLGVVVAAYNQTAMSAYDTITLMGDYYTVPILTGTSTDTPATLPIGIDAKGFYVADDMKYIDELHAILGDSGGAGTTYTMRNDINMGAAGIDRLTNAQTFNAGTGGRIVLDGNGKKLSVKVGGTAQTRSGLFGVVNGKLTIKKLNVKAIWRLIGNANYSAYGVLIGMTQGAGVDVIIDDVHVDMNGDPGTEGGGWWALAGGLIGYASEGSATITKSSVVDINWNSTADVNHALGGLVGYSNAALSISESFVTGTIRGSNLSSNSGVGGFLGRSQSNGVTITNSYTSMNVSSRAGDTTGTNANGGIGIFIGAVHTTSSSSITKSYGRSTAADTRFVQGGNAGTQTQTYSNIAAGSCSSIHPKCCDIARWIWGSNLAIRCHNRNRT